ncbi:MAG: DUF2971 domain-containing protein [Methylococcales bacterium]
MSTYDQFKYSPINKNFIDLLIKGYIYCANLEKLNDPFDCQVDINNSIQRAISQCSGKGQESLKELVAIDGYLQRIQDIAKNIGVCSFSKHLLNPVMWSHYAEEHRGICLLYRFPKEFINDDNPIIGITDITYEDSPLTDWFIGNAMDLASMDLDEIGIEVSKKLFSIKGKNWGYEDEVRILSRDSGELQIDKSHLGQVCFGMHTSERDKELVREIIQSSGYKVEFCEIVKDETDFGLSARDL